MAYWTLDDGNTQLARDFGPMQSPLFLGETVEIESLDPRWVERVKFNLGESFRSTVYAAADATAEILGQDIRIVSPRRYAESADTLS